MIRALLLVALALFPQEQPLATLEGTVVDSVTGQPIAGAHVTISSNLYGVPETARRTAPAAPTATSLRRPVAAEGNQAAAPAPPLPTLTNRDTYTDEQGRFAIADVPAVPYSLGTAAEGYVFQIYGQKTAFGGLTPVKLVAGNSPANKLTIRLDPAAAVSGIVTDRDRKPLARAIVYLLQTAYSIDGGARPYVNGEAQTDDAGKFSLKGVAAGSYRLVTGIDTFMPRNSPPTDLYAWTFYPGVVDSSLAAKIDVLPGAHMDIGTVTIQKEEPRAIRGRVIDSRTGMPPAGARLSAVSRTPFDRSGRASEEVVRSGLAYDGATGAFEFSNLRRGRYRLDVALPTPANSQTVASAPFAVPQDAFTFVDVLTTDVNNVVLSVPSSSTLRTKVVVSGEEPLSIFDKTSAARPQFRLSGTQALQSATGFIFVTAADGAFEVRSPLDGRYRVSLGPLAANYYISELRLDGVRAPNDILEIHPNSNSDLTIIVRRDGGQIEGNVLDGKNQPVPGVRGIMLPEPLPEVISRYYPIYSNPDGKFNLRGVEPGNYRAYVWEGLGELQVFDRDLWQRTRTSAPLIRVDAGSHVMTNIKVLTP